MIGDTGTLVAKPAIERQGGRAQARPLRPALLAGALLIIVGLPGCSPRPSAITRLTPPQSPAVDAGDPAIACDPARGDVLLSWLAGDSTGYRVWFARSADQGSTWAAPVAVSPPGEPLRIHPESSPRMVCDGEGRVGIAWSTSVEVPGRRFPASDLRFARSLDHGLTWGDAVTLNDDTASGPGSHAFHDIALLGHGAIVAAWLDSRPGGDGNGPDSSEGHDASIHMTRSGDFGAHWQPNTAQGSRVCPCCRVNLAVDPAGAVHSAYRKHFPGNIRDVVIARGDDAPMRANLDSWEIGGCPHSGPPILSSGDGTLRIAWFTGSEGRAGVWFRRYVAEHPDSTSAPLPVLVGEELPTVHVALADAGTAGTLVACDADSSGARRLTLARIESGARSVRERFVVPATAGASHPRIAVQPFRADAYVVWSTQQGERGRLQLARWRTAR